MKMKNAHTNIPASGPETFVKIENRPSVGWIFLKAILVAPFRANTLSQRDEVPGFRMVFNNFIPDPKQIQQYKTVCGFSLAQPDTIPISYLQTLFIGFMGKCITASVFPINPLGLIQIFQSLEQKRAVRVTETLDLSCTLLGFNTTEKGVESKFIQEIRSGNEIVWQGLSIFLTRSPVREKKENRKPDDIFLEKQETLHVPSDTGRRYARVSGDYNPHHLFPALARLFGFKKAIAHGMWTLARVVASLENKFQFQGPISVEGAFKLPVFMPATIEIGYECTKDKEAHQDLVTFELRDKQKGVPHLKGQLLHNEPK